ncbi:Alpha-D-GlcNAc alpha-1,2-L-rhamnosyltransferase [hydrothermal vent metagenome]|uniref:Alpha-D-GlcNAc alpha-1,2-L-rhamnosyltransferase n=1 Tax=hydrothermal vent metagenome TaxID=652676 RepID=A0A3B1AZX2_9ZZZZ
MVKIRVAVLGTRGFPNIQGGVETHCENLYPALVKLGVDVTVFARKGYVQSNSYEYKGVKIRPLWSPRRKSTETIIHTLYGVISIALRQKQFDIIHIHSIGPSLLVPLARMTGLKVVVTNHGADYERKKWGRIPSMMLKLGETLGCKFGSQVIAVSKHIKGQLEKKYGRSCIYISNGVQASERSSSLQLQQRYDLSKRRYLLAVGRLVPEKGFHDLIKAFNTINPSDWKLVIAGGADHEDDYSCSLYLGAAKNKNIVMTGRLSASEVNELYSNAAIFVSPSYHEGLPLVILEAMSFGLPLIVSDIEANKELAENKEDTFPVGDVDALAKKIKVYTNKSGSIALNEDFITRVKVHFNWENISKKTLAIYRKALKLDIDCG